ncbi:MAG: hypothetical protein R2909_01825 [Gemmatimonadales bacterium]
MRGLIWTAGAIAAAVAACGEPATVASDEGGSVSITWDGQYRGHLEGPATATWCAVDSMLQVLAIKEDTAVGFALYAPDTLRVGQHPVLSPQIKVDWRPLAAAAMRWLSPTELVGFEGVSGVVSVTAVDSTGVSGTFDIGYRVPAGSDTIRATGSFDRLVVTPARGSCGRANKGKGG